MKKKNFGSILLALCLMFMTIMMSGCGESEPSPLEGKWIAIVGVSEGISVPIKDVIDGSFEFVLKKGHKVELIADDESGKGKWEEEGNTITIKIQGETLVGEVGEDIITFDNMMDTGVQFIFAKEGTDAMDPSLY